MTGWHCHIKSQLCVIYKLYMGQLQSNISLKQSVENVEKNVADCRDTIKKSIEELKSEFQSKITDHDDRIVDLESKACNLDSDIKRINLEQERMYITINKLNLVLMNLKEPRNERPDVLLVNVKKQLELIDPEAAMAVKKSYRVGQPKTDSNRPIKIIFSHEEARDVIFYQRRSIVKPLVLCEDLPFVTRMDHKKLLKLKHDALAKSPNELVLLHIQKRQITIGNKLIRIIHGERTEEILTADQIKKLHPKPTLRIEETIQNGRTSQIVDPSPSPTRSTTHLFTTSQGATASSSYLPSNLTEGETGIDMQTDFLGNRAFKSMNPWMKP